MRKKVYYRYIKKDTNNDFLYEFCGISMEDLSYYLYLIGIEKKDIYLYRDIPNYRNMTSKKFCECIRRKNLFTYNKGFSSIKTANDALFLLKNNNSKIFQQSLDDLLLSKEFDDFVLFAYAHDHDWKLYLYIDNELLANCFINYIKRKTNLIFSVSDFDYN